MNRLTEKANIDYRTNAVIHTVGFVVTGDTNKDYNNALKKLYELENLEEQLGCPLDVVFKALKQNYIYEKGINVYGNYDKRFIFNKCEYLHLTYNPAFESFVIVHLNLGFYDYPVKLQDYKKTWWLKEDRSE